MDSLLNAGSKKYFFHVLASIVSEVLPFKGVPRIRLPLITFSQAHFRHHATCHSKALKEYFSNIYTFIMQKCCIFQVESFIILAFFIKNCVNSLKH